MYASRWSAERIALGVTTAKDERARIQRYALPVLGSMRLDEVRARHVGEVVRTLKKSRTLAPRTIRHVYATLHTMFRDAMVEERILANPCVLQRGELPPNIDKDPEWRERRSTRGPRSSS